jgi:hypothetical protein
MRRSHTLACVVVALAAALSPACGVSRAADPGIDFFEKKVRPILTQHCYGCHSAAAKKRRGGLYLDSRDALRKGGDTGPAVVPGKPAASLLLKAVRYDDDVLRMPPKGKLPDAVIADLEKWIALGAPDPRAQATPVAGGKGIDLEQGRKFWCFQQPQARPVPAVRDAAWPRTDLDRFILARLEAQGLRPVADADRVTLIRRATFDLVGLPPAPAEIDAFVNDPSPDAFARVVDRLLASPQFGERWGRHWLDVARFAESSGGGRSLLFPDAWRYRDYVIDAFNTDRPYDRFITEQIAGDLLPYATPAERHRQLVAAGFLALGPTNYEQQDKDVLEMDVVDEQIDTIGRVFLGMTIGCARCHDHKFDPIPTRDYYALAGILKSTQTLIHDNVSRWVDQPLPLTAGQAAAFKQHEAAVAALQDKVRLAKEADRKAGRVAAVPAKGVLAVGDLPGIVLDDSQAKKVGEWKLSKFSGNYIGDGYLYDDRSVKSEKTLTFVPEFARAGRYEVRLAYVAHANRADNVPVTILHLDGETTVHVNMRAAPPLDGRFVSLGKYRFNTNGQWFVLVSNAGTTGHISVDAVQFLPEEEPPHPPAPSPTKGRGGEKQPSSPPSPLVGQGGKAGVLGEGEGDTKALEAALKKLMENGPPRPLAMGVKDAAVVEGCAIRIRGNTHNQGEKVPRGFLQVASLGPAPQLPARESGRRQLAAWLSSRDNPLTARVMVNRVWHHLFGAGLVRSVDVFGATGDLPSHPELLDNLALDFRADWSVKRLIRRLMLSRTYQLASVSQKEGLAADPENRLLWRMNRRRLEAEALRDAMLTVSGRLDHGIGGPNVKKGTASEYGYQFDDTRRSVYAPVFRNRLLELFEAFDFADPNLVLGRRNVSTVATQALYLMNSPFVMEQARHAARAALAVPDLDDRGRVERAYRTALGRFPSDGERRLALRFLGTAGDGPERRPAAWERFYQALFASIDFRYVD